MEHKSEVDLAFSRVEPSISEFTFTNLFIWRYYYKISVSKLPGFLLFLAAPAGKPPFFFPPWGSGDVRPVVKKCLQFLREQHGGGCIERVPEDYLARLPLVNSQSTPLNNESKTTVIPAQAGIQPAGGSPTAPTGYYPDSGGSDLDVIADPDNDDYVYNSRDLVLLKGRKYDAKRNYIRKFQRGWRWEYRRVNKDLIQLCLELHDYWCTERKCDLYPGLLEEKRAIVEAFNHFEALGIKGGAIVIGGKVEAFSLGEKLNKDTFVVHIEKANPQITGLYAVINQQFAENEASGYTYVNREQDLGDEGLRMAKESYQPVFKVRKFKICPESSLLTGVQATLTNGIRGRP